MEPPATRAPACATIVVVEHDPTLHLLAERILEGEGWRTRAVGSGRAALAELEAAPASREGRTTTLEAGDECSPLAA